MNINKVIPDKKGNIFCIGNKNILYKYNNGKFLPILYKFDHDILTCFIFQNLIYVHMSNKKVLTFNTNTFQVESIMYANVKKLDYVLDKMIVMLVDTVDINSDLNSHSHSNSQEKSNEIYMFDINGERLQLTGITKRTEPTSTESLSEINDFRIIDKYFIFIKDKSHLCVVNLVPDDTTLSDYPLVFYKNFGFGYDLVTDIVDIENKIVLFLSNGTSYVDTIVKLEDDDLTICTKNNEIVLKLISNETIFMYEIVYCL